MKTKNAGLKSQAIAWCLGALAVGLSGCSTPSENSGVVIAGHAPVITAGAQAHAVCAGLTRLDPAAYDGWDGECPGCDIDARGLGKLCEKTCSHLTLLLNEQATKAGFEQAILAEAKDLVRGDLLIVTLSGHGGQVADTNGDEADGLDETVCLWDGQMVDDHVLEIITKLPPGLRVLLVTDTCHSEGNFRAFVRYAKKIVTLGALGQKPRTRPLVRKIARGWDGQLIQLAACREAGVSHGDSTLGGTWTSALTAAFPTAATLRAWFDSAKKTVDDERQQPQWVEFGNVTDAFRFSVPLQ